MIGRFTWQAGRDGVAHAVPSRGRRTRTACNLEAAVVRRPARTRCPRCLVLVGLPPSAGDAA